MRKTIVLCVIFGMFFILGNYTKSYSATHTNKVNAIEEKDKIDLKGDLERKSGPRSASDDVTAEKSGDAILITFHANVGNVAVRVVDDMGEECYYRVVNSTQQPTLHISTLGLAKGFYTLTMDNGNGVMWGEFEL